MIRTLVLKVIGSAGYHPAAVIARTTSVSLPTSAMLTGSPGWLSAVRVTRATSATDGR